jgi:hypothetical protein
MVPSEFVGRFCFFSGDYRPIFMASASGLVIVLTLSATAFQQTQVVAT